MKLRIISCLIFLQVFCLINVERLNCQSYVTYEITDGRLGDRLISYCHAKWLSYKYGLKLLYKPFAYADKLMMSQIEMPFEQANHNRVIVPIRGDNPDYFDNNNILFDISYFPECKEELARLNKHNNYYYHFDVDYKNPEFKGELQKALKPIIELETIKPPKDCVSLAVHVRRNSGGFDSPLSFEVIERLGYLPEGVYTDFIFPLKHPSDDYYIEQIKKAVEFFDHQKMYIYLFTDDPTPSAIVEKYRKILSDYPNITFDCRKTENKHYLNVLEDLFSLINFDALIRADSNLAIVASMIGNFKLVISPRDYKKIGHKIIIDQVTIETII